MDIYKVKFIEKIKRTEMIYSFRFSYETKVDFKAGQFMKIIFDKDNLNNQNLNKFLSLSCSPQKEYIEVSKRISESDFSKKLLALKKGDEINIQAPMGNCVLKDDYKKICFLIGGIGSTPAISMIEDIYLKNLPIDIVFLYANRNPLDIAFRKELDEWSKKINLKLINLVSENEPYDENCLQARLDKDAINKFAEDYLFRKIFVFGSPMMVKAISQLCLEMNCQKENLIIENFMGY